jgi:hypothetical protein
VTDGLAVLGGWVQLFLLFAILTGIVLRRSPRRDPDDG